VVNTVPVAPTGACAALAIVLASTSGPTTWRVAEGRNRSRRPLFKKRAVPETSVAARESSGSTIVRRAQGGAAAPKVLKRRAMVFDRASTSQALGW
jgi:hypothetical protein